MAHKAHPCTDTIKKGKVKKYFTSGFIASGQRGILTTYLLKDLTIQKKLDGNLNLWTPQLEALTFDT